jgi:urocanate hydratase
MTTDFLSITRGILEGIPEYLPEKFEIPHYYHRAPRRIQTLTLDEKRLALRNALRYFPSVHHQVLASEFLAELETYGHIYMYRYMPRYRLTAYPAMALPHRSIQAACIMMMILNNLDPEIAQHPAELVTYGGTGTVFQNWAQFRLTMKYLAEMNDSQTLALYSGHPLGLFHSRREAPRVVVTNGMVVPNYSTRDDFNRMNALGVTNYGQMTAGGFMYIGPQGIVHGTTITVKNALQFSSTGRSDTTLPIFVSSGLGGMSGAQAKAGKIAGFIAVVAEVNEKALEKRLGQGWVDVATSDLSQVLQYIKKFQDKNTPASIAYQGNVIDLWECLFSNDVKVDVGSDQTSLHIPFTGGYYPVGLSLTEANEMIAADSHRFKALVQESLRRQVAIIDKHTAQGMFFFDYGNGFLLEASRAGAPIVRPDGSFRYQSYVEKIMGPGYFDYGFGPFRWICTSGSDDDLLQTDKIAIGILEELLKVAPRETKGQLKDNLQWLREAESHKLVVGSRARILYADCEGRRLIATALNEAIGTGRISAPIVIGRDHHDVSGTDSPYRETSNIHDGSKFTADMAVHTFVGNSFRGATWVALHNGGGVGWGEVINGGFGLVLDGTSEAGIRAENMLNWDVHNGVARRAWAGNKGAIFATNRAQAQYDDLKVTVPFEASDEDLDAAFFTYNDS